MDLDTEFASDFSMRNYHSLRSDLYAEQPGTKNWTLLIDAFKRRMDERFLRPVAELASYDDMDPLPMRPGFAILALDCLLIDTLQSFREGRVGTGDSSPAHSFKAFLRNAPDFGDFGPSDRSEFFSYVRNGLLHNGEAREDWKIRIDTSTLLTKDKVTKSRTINRQLFHAGVLKEFQRFNQELGGSDPAVRVRFLRRTDAICAWPIVPLRHMYFAYGSNLLNEEILKDAPEAEPFCLAYIPRLRLVFNKHSTERGSDAANVLDDSTATVWGYVYRLSDEGRKGLREREAGYTERSVDAVLLAKDETPSVVKAFTFVAKQACQVACGAAPSYLDVVVAGALQRGLPEDYVSWLRAQLN